MIPVRVFLLFLAVVGTPPVAAVDSALGAEVADKEQDLHLHFASTTHNLEYKPNSAHHLVIS